MAKYYPTLRQANLARNEELAGPVKLSLSFAGNELAGEVGEACNIMKKLDREELGIRGSRSTPEALREELADVLICVDLIAMRFGFDMAKAVEEKFNKTSAERNLETKLRYV